MKVLLFSKKNVSLLSPVAPLLMRKYLSEPVVLKVFTKSPVGLLLNPSPFLIVASLKEHSWGMFKRRYLVADTVMPGFVRSGPN